MKIAMDLIREAMRPDVIAKCQADFCNRWEGQYLFPLQIRAIKRDARRLARLYHKVVRGEIRIPAEEKTS